MTLTSHIDSVELNNNQTVNDRAKEQAGTQNNDFEISNFNYNVSIVADLMRKYLEDTSFDGVSVYRQDVD